MDTIFDADLSIIDRTDADGIIWTKEVEDYQRFGVVVTDATGNMTQIIEKPSTPISKRANIGLYVHPQLEAALRGDHRDHEAPAEQGRVLSHRRVPVHDRPRCEAQSGRRGRMVRRAANSRRSSTRTA